MRGYPETCMIARLLLQSTITTAAMGALLFASAGTLHWPSAWVFLATSALLGPLCGWWLYRVDPHCSPNVCGRSCKRTSPLPTRCS